MGVDQIKTHPFFYGVDWATIRQIDAPFVPHLRSIVDTSYFPTEEYENVPDQPVGADTSDAKDLAFLGYVVFTHLSRVTCLYSINLAIHSSASTPRRAQCKHPSPLSRVPLTSLKYYIGLDLYPF